MTTRVLVVDDSALMRRQLRTLLEEAGEFEVTTARNGEDALTQCRERRPDVVTLDINMPVMDGLTCLSHLMIETPCPVIMVSSLTEKGALSTFEALELGAFDYVTKPDGTVSSNMRTVADALIDRVRAAAGNRRGTPERTSAAVADEPPVTAPARRNTAAVTFARPPQRELVVIGVSTGGPGTLETILGELPADFPIPIVIAQHMPARFTEVFAARLNDKCAVEVQEVRGPVRLQPGNVYMARGEADMRIVRRGTTLVAKSLPSSDRYLWHPSVSRLVASVLEVVTPSRLIAVQLTGMGYDGAEEMADAHRRGALTLAESERSAVVYGMPRVLIESGGAEVVCDSRDMAAQLMQWLAAT
ncbi:chemotaxis-specific protein-glutamate methyltransferase CheB [Kushneria aurantia]|uniref:Protein-glutamate methylesterase/protein-glutamine glutaminase n=1 Tax=Kushneria aurantia TaxID=504092 RepID=A0ABV6G774_9GAMM|nr:chemotaxis-specific protein-glutamate methyltransferase CheB [Kushneria aurantia]